MQVLGRHLNFFTLNVPCLRIHEFLYNISFRIHKIYSSVLKLLVDPVRNFSLSFLQNVIIIINLLILYLMGSGCKDLAAFLHISGKNLRALYTKMSVQSQRPWLVQNMLCTPDFQGSNPGWDRKKICYWFLQGPTDAGGITG